MTRLTTALLVVVAFVWLTATHSASAADPTFIALEVDAPGRLTVGDHFRYVIRVEADRGSTIALAPGGLPNVLELTDRANVRSTPKGDRIELTMTLPVAAFAPGDLVVPPLKLRIRDVTGAMTDIETPTSRVVVESVLPATGDVEPRNLKPQFDVGSAPPASLLPYIAALALALVVVGGLLVWRLRRTVPVLEPVVMTVELGPEDRARARLDTAGADFAARREYIPYYEEIAITVRSYLTERFGFAAFAMTTRELGDQMLNRGVDRWQARLVRGLLSQCDAVVFAGYRPALERADADLTAAYEIVEMSRPQPLVAREEATVL